MTDESSQQTTQYEYVDIGVDIDDTVEIPDDAIGVTTEYENNALHGEEYIVRYLKPVQSGDSDE